MKYPIPEEVIELYGIMAVSKIARKKTKLRQNKLPKVLEALKKRSGDSGKAAKTLANFDVETGGMSDEFEDFMREGFLCLIPDEDCPDPAKWPGPDFTPPDLTCAQIRIAADDLLEEHSIHLQAAQRLRVLVDALDKNAHPIIIILAALFKAALEDAEARMAEIAQDFADLVQSAEVNGCDYPVFTF